jgi:hypothetical protein
MAYSKAALKSTGDKASPSQHIYLRCISVLHNSVGIEMDYELEGRGSIAEHGINFPLPHSGQTGSGIHQVSYRQKHETDNSPQSSAAVKNGGTEPTLPHTS